MWLNMEPPALHLPKNEEGGGKPKATCPRSNSILSAAMNPPHDFLPPGRPPFMALYKLGGKGTGNANKYRFEKGEEERGDIQARLLRDPEDPLFLLRRQYRFLQRWCPTLDRRAKRNVGRKSFIVSATLSPPIPFGIASGAEVAIFGCVP